ncbi:ArsR/SmtB family transcription factor [Megasphaera paucivorans]|jgi:ArsR family transcriptional regulator|uniref:Transcriptional regulator, ArsR family n=1 Tax=Megasphaera paucivorans TaxID=349095 RepID=A0A1G9RJN4_9FIRM|nr:metalloregulator ArsR/SmtB family transcription factor [Megasphaera paucivorans]SDM23270.1 transcriptional regulator, ArsR family [Megasphaera paucivorans]
MEEKLIDELKALSDETRLRILNLLYENELCVCVIMELLQITQAKASRHLIYLKNVGLVKDRKQAQWSYYSMQKDKKEKFLDSLVYDKLRTIKLYQKDMDNLHKWIQEENNVCDNSIKGVSNDEKN